MSAALIFAFTAGVAATVNPCGFALLPAWFARQFGQDSGQPLLMRLPRAIGAGASVAAGFVLVFAVAALVLGAAVARLGAVLPYAGVALGVALLAVGLGWAGGISLLGMGGAACRRIDARFGAFGFGLSYGTVSLSCALPIFMSVAGVAFLQKTQSWLAVGAYLGGAASVLIVVSVAAALTGNRLGALAQTGRGWGRLIGGLMTAGAGFYIAVYWAQAFFPLPSWLLALVAEGGLWSSRLIGWLSGGAVPALLLFSLLFFAGLAWVITRRRQNHREYQAVPYLEHE